MPTTKKSIKHQNNKNIENIVKAYNMAITGESTAEINLYGTVVAVAPRDWETKKRLAGYIGLDEFLEDLEEIKDKDDITVHINSEGGDLYAGLAIYNRLKALKGTVTTINDGLAASAASLIFQAGDVRKMNSGSNLMAHGASGFLFGYYNIDELEELVTQFEAHNKAIVNVYAEAMKVTHEEAKRFINGETWLTGEEAVKKGLADEIVQVDEGGAQNTLMHKVMEKMAAAYKAQFPAEAISAKMLPFANTNPKETGGKKDMDFKNIEELKAAYPGLVAEIENAAKTDAQKAKESKQLRQLKTRLQTRN